MDHLHLRSHHDLTASASGLLQPDKKRSVASLSSAFDSILKQTELSAGRNLNSLNDGSEMKNIIDSSNAPRIGERSSSEPSRLKEIHRASRMRDNHSGRDKSSHDSDPSKIKSSGAFNESGIAATRESAPNYQNDLEHGSVISHRGEGETGAYEVSSASNKALPKDTMVKPHTENTKTSPVIEISELTGVSKREGDISAFGTANEHNRNLSNTEITARFGVFSENSRYPTVNDKTKAIIDAGTKAETMPLGNSFNEGEIQETYSDLRASKKTINLVNASKNRFIQDNHVDSSEQKMLSDKNLGINDLRKTQATLLASKLGADSFAKVNVDTTDQNSLLISKPGSVLSSGVITGSQLSLSKTANRQSKININSPQNSQGIGVNPANLQSLQVQTAQNQNLLQNNISGTNMNSLAAGKGNTILGQGLGNQGSFSGEPGGSPLNNNQQTGDARQARQHQKGHQVNPNTRNQFMSSNNSVAQQISIKIMRAIQAGSDRIQIQLKPSELGRVDVKMELAHDGRVMAIVTADNKETLDLLRRDASELQRALGDTGMNLNSGDLSFNLRGDEGKESEIGQKIMKPLIEEDEASSEDIISSSDNMLIENDRVITKIDIKA